MLHKDSEIGVRVNTTWGASDIEKFIASKTWHEDVRRPGAIFDMFKSDDDDYIVAKSGNGIVLMRKADSDKYITTMFEPNEDGVTVPSQILRAGNDTLADKPEDPTSSDPEAIFLKWCEDRTCNEEYIFSEAGATPLPGEGSPLVATIYGLWKKYIKVTIVTNTGGVGLDGKPLPAVKLNNQEVSEVKLFVYMGNALSESDKIEVNGTTTVDDINKIPQPIFEREGMTAFGNWYTKNGFKDGTGDGEWGDEWFYDDGLEHTLTKDITLYVRWRGHEYKANYEYYDSESVGVNATGSTATVNKYVSDDNKDYSVQYYNNVMADNTIFTPVRYGYEFVNWHASPSESFSDANIVTKDTPYLWNGDITLYAEWKPVEYNVVYVAKPGEIDDGAGNVVTATRVNATYKFDEGLRNPNLKLPNDVFKRNGYKLSAWDYKMSMRGNSEETMTIDTLIGDTNFYNAKVEQDATTKAWRVVEGEPTELKVEWEANRYKLILDLNDGSAGNSDTYKGSNFVSTTSITGSVLY